MSGPVRWVIVLAAVVLFTASLGVLIWTEVSGGTLDVGEAVGLGTALTSFFVVGIAIVLRRSGHAIGWLFVGIAVYAMGQGALTSIGEQILARGGSHIVYAMSNVAFSWPTLLGVMLVVVPLLFPTGRLPSRRWRWLAWFAGTAIGLATLANTFQRDVCVTYDAEGNCLSRVDNPIGLYWLESFEESALGAVLFGALAVSFICAGASLIFRYRRAAGVERAQLRWITFAVGLLLSYILVMDIIVGDVLGLEAEVTALVPSWIDPFGILLAFVPISVGVAILRYRLYDIDRIISRTVSYGLVTAVLLSAYAGVVFIFGRMLPGQSDLAVAGSTLAVAALFNPVRRRIQVAVDRRFNRLRYDSERVAADFARRLQSEAGLIDLSRDLAAVARITVQPEWTSLWLKEPTS